jgi:hypothetical protein
MWASELVWTQRLEEKYFASAGIEPLSNSVLTELPNLLIFPDPITYSRRVSQKNIKMGQIPVSQQTTMYATSLLLFTTAILDYLYTFFYF